MIYTNKYFRDYLLFGHNGSIYFYSLPNLENINCVKLIEERLYRDLTLIAKVFQNKSKNIENLIVCNKKSQIIYIIGEK